VVVTVPAAIARRAVTSFSETSTMRAAPVSSTCVNWCSATNRAYGCDVPVWRASRPGWPLRSAGHRTENQRVHRYSAVAFDGVPAYYPVCPGHHEGELSVCRCPRRRNPHPQLWSARRFAPFDRLMEVDSARRYAQSAQSVAGRPWETGKQALTTHFGVLDAIDQGGKAG
jgi:hypothetical protein